MKYIVHEECYALKGDSSGTVLLACTWSIVFGSHSIVLNIVSTVFVNIFFLHQAVVQYYTVFGVYL